MRVRVWVCVVLLSRLNEREVEYFVNYRLSKWQRSRFNRLALFLSLCV